MHGRGHKNLTVEPEQKVDPKTLDEDVEHNIKSRLNLDKEVEHARRDNLVEMRITTLGWKNLDEEVEFGRGCRTCAANRTSMGQGRNTSE